MSCDCSFCTLVHRVSYKFTAPRHTLTNAIENVSYLSLPVTCIFISSMVVSFLPFTFLSQMTTCKWHYFPLFWRQRRRRARHVTVLLWVGDTNSERQAEIERERERDVFTASVSPCPGYILLHMQSSVKSTTLLICQLSFYCPPLSLPLSNANKPRVWKHQSKTKKEVNQE